MTIYWATKLRGFLRHLSSGIDTINFVEKDAYYETNSWFTRIKSRMIRLPLFDPVGLFQMIKIAGQDCDAYASFNRFLDSDKPYFIYLENPVALYHYTLGRISWPSGRKKFQACLSDPNLRYIVCMSEACRSTFEQINMPLPEHIKMKTIYPSVPENPHATVQSVEEKSQNEYLECLLCVQGIRFISKGGLEVLAAYENLKKQGVNINLTIITKISDLDQKILRKINRCENIKLHDFSFSYAELEKIYAKTNILLQPSSDDSFGLTVLEAIKGGCAIVASKLYGFPEMVEDGINGFLLEPKYWFFDRNNIPNPSVWNHRKKTILCPQISDRLVEEIENAILSLYNDRERLAMFSKNSLKRATDKFGTEHIYEEWEDVWRALEEMK